MPNGYGRQQPNKTPSLNDLNLPIIPFNMMMPISLAPITEEYIDPPKKDEISTEQPSMMVSSANAWDISSHAGTFLFDEPRRISCLELILHTAAPERTEAKSDQGNVYSQKRGLSQPTCKACSQPLLTRGRPQCSEYTQFFFFIIYTLSQKRSCICT